MPGKFVGAFRWLHKAVFNKWFVDELYDALFVNPTKKLGTFLWKGFDVKVVDGVVNGVGYLVRGFSQVLRITQSGQIHGYAMTMVVGMVVLVAVYVFR